MFQVKKINRTLYQLCLNTKNKNILKEVKFFSMQILHYNIRITGADLFEINTEILLTMDTLQHAHCITTVNSNLQKFNHKTPNEFRKIINRQFKYYNIIFTDASVDNATKLVENKIDSFAFRNMIAIGVLFLYHIQRLILRRVELISWLTVWDTILKFNGSWKFGKGTKFRYLVWYSQLKLITLWIGFTTYIIQGFSRFNMSAYDICLYLYAGFIFVCPLYMFHILYTLVKYWLENINEALNKIDLNCYKIKKLAQAYCDVIEISNAINDATSKYIGSIFAFATMAMIGQIYSLYKFAETNKPLVVITTEVNAVMSTFLTTIWIVLLVEQCRVQVGKMNRTLYQLCLNTKNRYMLKEVKLFSMQILHYRIKVTGADLFEINTETLFTVSIIDDNRS
ncbi:hypothetical protein HHI36_015753 [Cryptolaemus montrouzieri]|uniref:Gustatory receptor n=1 Tax=Cryptolaemus montrouzieri TaxID=559131 RepID=A0ABD2N7N0_9CUCU